MPNDVRRDNGAKFDLDLAEGHAGEDSFARLICWTRFEHKRDLKAEKTGNIAIEFEKLRPDGKKEPSGIALSEAEWLGIEYRRERRWLILRTEDAKRYAKRALHQKRERWGGDDQRSHFALVPLRWLVEVEAAVDD